MDSTIKDAIGQNTYFCEVIKYLRGHSALLIGVSKDGEEENQIFLVFDGVIYFEGVFGWKTTNLEINPVEERETLLRKIGFGAVAKLQKYVHNLYRFDCELEPIYILCKNMTIERDIPARFQNL